MSDTICGLSHFHPPHSWGDLNWCPGDPDHAAENDARPDVPRVGLFNRHADAVAEASFRAAVSRRRYRVRWEPNNRWWQITEAWPNVHVIPPGSGVDR